MQKLRGGTDWRRAKKKKKLVQIPCLYRSSSGLPSSPNIRLSNHNLVTAPAFNMGSGKKEATRRVRQKQTGDGLNNVKVKGENFYRYACIAPPDNLPDDIFG